MSQIVKLVRFIIANGVLDVSLGPIDTSEMLDQVRNIVQTKIDGIDFQIKQLVNNENST